MRYLGIFGLFILLACGSSAERKLRGVWVLDTQETLEPDTQTNPDPAVKPSGFSVFLKSLAANVQLELEFQKGGTLISRRSILGSGTSETRQWQVGESKDPITLRLSDDQFRTFDEWQIQFVDANHFKAKVFGQAIQLSFKRVER